MSAEVQEAIKHCHTGQRSRDGNDWYHMRGERELETGDDGRWAPSGRSEGGTEGR